MVRPPNTDITEIVVTIQPTADREAESVVIAADGLTATIKADGLKDLSSRVFYLAIEMGLAEDDRVSYRLTNMEGVGARHIITSEVEAQSRRT